MDDRDLDALVHRAAARPTDEARLAQYVLRRVRQGRMPESWFRGAGLAVAGFAALLVLTPVAIAAWPADPVDGFLSLAYGNPAAWVGAGELR